MLPFNVIGELTRMVALALRLFGNVLSGSMMVAAALAIAPLFFPLVMSALGLMIGLIQPSIFAMFALVFISSPNQAQQDPGQTACTSAQGAAGQGRGGNCKAR